MSIQKSCLGRPARSTWIDALDEYRNPSVDDFWILAFGLRGYPEMVGVIMTWQVFMKGQHMGGQNPKIIQNQMVDSYLFGGCQSIALVALEVIF